MFALDCDRAYLYPAHPERELTSTEMQRYDEALARRATGVPAQYITGHQEFWGLDFLVSPAVLIPRPETEHVVEAVLELASSADSGQSQQQGQPQRTGVSAPHGLFIVDVGTGSGAIALALASELPTAEIRATDISAGALEIARANAARLELGSRVEFSLADLLGGVAAGIGGYCRFESSLRWRIGRGVGAARGAQIRAAERGFAGPTGLEVIERLIPQAQTIPSDPAVGWCSRSAGRLQTECTTYSLAGTRSRSGTTCKGSRE